MIKIDFDVLSSGVSAETKRQLDAIVRDDVDLLVESPVHTSTSGRPSRRRALRARLAKLGGAS